MNIGINGFGRIGRQICKAILENYPEIKIVQVNDITDTHTLAHLYKYDSNYGVYKGEVKYEDSYIIIDGRKIYVSAEKDPNNLKWADEINVVIESTGAFTSKEKASTHIKGNVKKVIVTAPSKGADITIVLGVNESSYDPQKHNVISNASCTTNSLAPVVKVLNDNFKVKKGFMTTVHSYTNDQRILDLPHKDLRRARAAALNIIPTTTGAATAVGEVIPELKGKLTGISLRVPTPTVSITDFVCLVEKGTTKEEVNKVLEEASNTYLKGILGFTLDPIVSMDLKGSTYSGIVDGLSTDVLEGDFLKVLSWYDNEWAYSVRVADLLNFISKQGAI